MNLLQQKYKDEVRPKLKQQFSYANDMQIPAIQKVTINMGVGEAVTNKDRIEEAVKALGAIAGQKPVITKARRSISQFRLREGMPIGAKVTLRGRRMFEFLERLFVVVIPRLRDFRGLPNKFDGRGNYSVGFAEQVVFPEINLDKIKYVQGMDITISTTSRTDAEGLALLTELGLPFKR